MARMDKASLRVSLQPPAPLVLRFAGGIGCLHVRRGCEHLDPVTSQRQPEREVGVFGHVVRIPRTSDGHSHTFATVPFPSSVCAGHGFERMDAEMVARASKWRYQPQPGKTQEQALEVGNVLG